MGALRVMKWGVKLSTDTVSGQYTQRSTLSPTQLGLECLVGVPGCTCQVTLDRNLAANAGRLSQQQELHTSVLDEALQAVFGNRQKNYGHPRENFQRIAILWTAWLKARYPSMDITLDNLDVAQMMIGVKQGRLIETPEHRDSYVDIAGYAEAGARAVGVDE